MKNTKNYRIDFENQAIVINRKFAKAVSELKRESLKEMTALRTAFPDYIVTLRTCDTVKTEKNTYRHLTFDFMREEIIRIDGETSPNISSFDNSRNSKVPYATVKKWFLDIYKDRMKKTVEMPTGTTAKCG